jgi:hypothetical protein
MSEQKKVQYLAIGGEPDHFHTLPPAAAEQWKKLEARIGKDYMSDDAMKRSRAEMSGCLAKLSAALLQVRRMRVHHDELVNKARSTSIPPGGVMAWNAIEVLADFEALILQSRSALDRLAACASSDLGQFTSSFRKLRNDASSRAGKLEGAQRVVHTIDAAASWSDGLLAGVESEEALRDLVSHKHSLTEGVETCISVVALPSTGRLLLFDCEVRLSRNPQRTALLHAARETGQYLPFIVLNVLSALLAENALTLSAYEPEWTNVTVSRGPFIAAGEPGRALGEYSLGVARRMLPHGISLDWQNYDPSLWDRAVDRASLAAAPAASAASETSDRSGSLAAE